MIGTFSIVRAEAGSLGFLGGHFRQVHAPHQPVHSPDTDGYAIITLKDVLDFVCSQAFVEIGVNMQKDALYTLVFTNAGSRLSSKMLVISAPVDTQNTAESLDVMLETELVDGL